MRLQIARAFLVLAAFLSGCAANKDVYGPLAYPKARTTDTVDDYHGVKVPDPYRWLEDAESAETRAFVDSQNSLFRDFVDGKNRDAIKSRLTDLWNYPRNSSPSRQGSNYVYSRNDGLQNQSVTYVHDVRNRMAARVLFDPNTMSKDGTVALSGTTFTRDGTLVAYGVSSGGSDQKSIHIRNVETGQDLPDVLEWCKFASIAWKPDNSGFWYNRYPLLGTVAPEDQARFNRLYWHTLGTKQDQDKVVYERPDDKDLSMSPSISDDGEYVFLYLSRGSGRKNRLYYRPFNSPEFIKLFDDEDASYSFIEHDGPIFYIRTDIGAPRGRVIAVDTRKPDRANWKDIIPESADTLSSVNMVGNHFMVTYLHDACTIMKMFDASGKFVKDIPMPAIGSISGASGRRTEMETFFTFTSFIHPPTIYRYDFNNHEVSVYNKSEAKFDTNRYESKQVFATSKDGTKVPLFITHKKGIKLDGNNPTLLNAYGGFNISQTPNFSISRAELMNRGYVIAVACLRGGGEYGEAWHTAGMRDRKQNVFDDFYACAQWLDKNGYARSDKLAIQGGSNGGLLVSACMTQRPELFGAVICAVPLTDMLRYHRFTVGRFWIPEYGSADASLSEFEFLRAYSPLHNIKSGTRYPKTLVMTADGDDRVAPLHARKFVAAVQANGDPNNLVYLRTETRAGHGGGKPTSKQINETADVYEFLARALNIDARK